MDSVAELGLRIDSSSVVTGTAALDKLTPAAIRAQQAQEALARSSVSATQAQRDAASALISNTQATLEQVRAKSLLQQSIIATTDSARKAALAKATQTQLDDYANRLEKQLAQQTRDAAGATDSWTASITRYNAVRQQSNNMQAQGAAQFQSGINANLGVGGTGNDTASRAQDVAAYGTALDQLRAKFNPVYAASKQYESALNAISAAEKVGAISAVEAAAAMETERLTFEAASVATGTLAKNHGMLNTQSMAAFHSVRSMIEGFAMGIPPTQIFAQQIGQMSYAASGPNGLVGALKSAGSQIGKLISPMVLLGGGVLGVAGAMAYLTYQAVATEKTMGIALLGTGRAAGVTASQLGDMATSAASAANIGVGSARKYAAEYASSGKIVGAQIEQLTALTQDYATTTRQGADEAAKELAGSFSDLSSGLDTMNKKLGFLSASERQHILDLVAQGQQNKATQETIDRLTPALARYNDQLTLFGRIWHSVSTGTSDFFAGFEALANPSTADNLKAAQAMLAQVKAAGGQLATQGGFVIDTKAAEAQVTMFHNKLVQEMAKAGKDAHDVFLNNLSLNAATISAATDPAITQINTLLNNRDMLKLAQSNGFPGMNATQIANATRALDQQRGALSSLADANGDVVVQGQRFLSQEQLQAKQDEVSIQGIYAKTAAQKASVAEAQMRLSLAGSQKTAAEQENLIALAGAQAYQSATKALSDQNQALSYNTRAVLASVNASMNGDIPALIASAAHYQALTEAISQGIDVRARERELIVQATASKVASAAADAHTAQVAADAQAEANTMVTSGALAYDKMQTFVSNRIRDAELEAVRLAAVASGNKQLADAIQIVIDKYVLLDKTKPANDNIAAALGSVNPYAADITAVKTLISLQQAALINQQQLTMGVGKTQLGQDLQGMNNTLGDSNPFGPGAAMKEQALIQAAQQQAAQLQSVADAAHAAGLISDQQYADAKVAIEQDAAAKIMSASQQVADAQLKLGEDAFASLANGVGALLGHTSAAYKAVFAIEKGFALARALMAEQVAIATAASLPWPENIPAITQAISIFGQILGDIGSIASPSGFASGIVGIPGPGSGISDSIGVRVSAGESIMTAAATRQNAHTLMAMNAGASFDRASKGSNDNRPIINIIHDGSTAVEYRETSDGHIELIAKRVVHREAPHVVASSQRDPNGLMAQATRETIAAGRRRS